MRKQGHVIKHWFYENKMQEPGRYEFFCKHHDKIIEKLIYPDMKHPLEFLSKKTPQNILSYRDTYITNLKTEPIYKVYANAAKKHLQAYPTNARAAKNNILTSLTSLLYYLEKP